MKIDIIKRENGIKKSKTINELEEEYILIIIKNSKNYSEAISKTGMARATFYKKINKILKKKSKNYLYKENVKFAS